MLNEEKVPSSYYNILYQYMLYSIYLEGLKNSAVLSNSANPIIFMIIINMRKKNNEIDIVFLAL